MSSSGLIFAVIVGAWAAYLVPMWLRRQDELNEARPTERFSTALRLLTRGRRGGTAAPGDDADDDAPAPSDAFPEGADVEDGLADVPADHQVDVPVDVSADVRDFAEPVTNVRPATGGGSAGSGGTGPSGPASGDTSRTAARARVLARRRRTTMVLFLAFTLGGIVALSSGPGLLWLPGVPAVLLLAYLVHIGRQERRRYAVAIDRRRAEEAARRLRERTQASAAARPEPRPDHLDRPDRADRLDRPERPARPARPAPERPARAVVEQTDHAEWVDQQRARGGAAPGEEPDTWDPAPVPLPTYVNAPVAPRTTRGVDLDAPDTWSAARSTTAGSATQKPATPDQPSQDATPRRTPLFDQYADDHRPRRRASGE
ncbi:divisome protein SepX/GlpR [Streptomyces sp. 4N509B]|uniref:divisome protein SepX/GlpR n=1 Tax=Streptomyces sp. 4N509B TaxID=3457413 RepID=UPI003FD36FAA